MNRLHRWYCASWHWKQTLHRSIIPWVLDGVDIGSDVLELGPGPGLATDVLRRQAAHVTAVEIDIDLARALRERMTGTNVKVIHGDATRMSLEDETFTSVVSFTMLHHLRSKELQDQTLRETRRVLSPGGIFAGSDSLATPLFRAAHLSDTAVPVDPEGFRTRLEAAGFVEIDISRGRRNFRFVAVRPARRRDQAA
ncbi:MAG: class I SAM-dependent methyltransferase [Actinomycetota bacterium]|nr:class I SAM-dependent methyltransferase [Actinomycetota bacterium]MDQ3575589.1 class I SAM-dependent methyltransferase [Actinomycetota bacterium]